MFLQLLNRLHQLDRLIAIANTGTPNELARKIKVSERCVRQYIAVLKKLGAPIAYSRKRKTYYYKKEGGFSFIFYSLQEIGNAI